MILLSQLRKYTMFNNNFEAYVLIFSFRADRKPKVMKTRLRSIKTFL